MVTDTKKNCIKVSSNHISFTPSFVNVEWNFRDVKKERAESDSKVVWEVYLMRHFIP